MPRPPANPSLTALRIFVGSWTLATPQFPAMRGRATFQWLDGGAFLVYRARSRPPFPSLLSIIGRDERSVAFSMLYFDSRGVARIYQMTFRDRVWRLRRKAPGFSQRFVGRFSRDGRTISGRWEKSGDGKHWTKDFDLTYTKAR
jgi:hypothetical protein